MSIANKNKTFGRAESYCQFGCDTLSKSLKGFETQPDGAINSPDVECVHEMRVNSRKISMFLSLFQSCCPMKIILNNTSLPLTLEERQIIASIAHYHIGCIPKQKHYNLVFLNRKTVNLNSALSGTLRITDVFDHLHNSNLNLLTIQSVPKKVMFEGISNSNTSLRTQAFDKKKNLFENFFKMKVMLTWLKQ